MADSTNYTLPGGIYYIGCPRCVLPDDAWHQWLELEIEYFQFQGQDVVSISTGADGVFPLYDKSEEEHADYLVTDVSTVAIIPMEALEAVGISWEEASEHGYVFDVGIPINEESYRPFEVTIHNIESIDGRVSTDHVDFLWLELLVADREKYESQ